MDGSNNQGHATNDPSAVALAPTAAPPHLPNPPVAANAMMPSAGGAPQGVARAPFPAANPHPPMAPNAMMPSAGGAPQGVARAPFPAGSQPVNVMPPQIGIVQQLSARMQTPRPQVSTFLPHLEMVLASLVYNLDNSIPGTPLPIPPGTPSFPAIAPNGTQYQLPRQFIEAYPGIWKAICTPGVQNMHHIYNAYSIWQQIMTQKQPQHHPGYRPTTSVAGSFPRQQQAQHHHPQQQQPRPGIAQVHAPAPAPITVVSPQIQMSNVQDKSRAATAELKQKREAQRRAGIDSFSSSFLSIVSPRNGEDQAFLPLPRLRSLVKETCGHSAKLAQEGEVALKALADDFVARAVGFGVDMARRKKAQKIDPADLALYFKRTWNIDVPGLTLGNVTPYRRFVPGEAHRVRLAAVRKANTALGQQKHVRGQGGQAPVPGKVGGEGQRQSPANPPPTSRKRKEASSTMTTEAELAAAVEGIEDGEMPNAS